jgi:cytochrome c peroxidase
MTMIKLIFSLMVSSIAAISLTGCGGDSSSSSPQITKAELGELLFSDKNLSLERTQSCATCHNPDKGFIDDRTNNSSINGGHGLVAGAGSLGDDQVSIGDRNAPTAAYTAFSPDFHKGVRQRPNKIMTDLNIGVYEGFMGGQFLDGRAVDLKAQAEGPPISATEMNMPGKPAVVERLKENQTYIEGFEKIYGSDVFDDANTAYAAMAENIGEFEKTAEFAPFDSKYDRTFLNFKNENYYEFPISSKALTGQVLFFSSNLTCAACHQLQPLRIKNELFTSFEFHNIGIPPNTKLRELNGFTTLDLGLLNNPVVTSELEKGKFKVPTLRNVAVTAPYMHNGVFNELETVIRFYQHAKDLAINVSAGGFNNPETGLPWAAAEINDNIAHDILGKSKQNLNDGEVEALVCFIISLTDARYEYLLDPVKVTDCGL